jgi:hypothetical protein
MVWALDLLSAFSANAELRLKLGTAVPFVRVTV